MTIIKVNCNMEMPKVCEECPFLKSDYYDLYCGLSETYIGESEPYYEHEKLSDCQLISIESQ